DEHKRLEGQTKTALMQTAAKSAVSAAQKPALDVSNTAQLRDLAASAARLFGWDKRDQPGVQLNQQIIISQEQLEQIRQLRGTAPVSYTAPQCDGPPQSFPASSRPDGYEVKITP